MKRRTVPALNLRATWSRATGYSGFPAKIIERAVVRRERILAFLSKNIEQECAADALISDNISVVALTGTAGAGKTLLALAAGLQLI